MDGREGEKENVFLKDNNNNQTGPEKDETRRSGNELNKIATFLCKWIGRRVLFMFLLLPLFASFILEWQNLMFLHGKMAFQQFFPLDIVIIVDCIYM